MARGVLQQRLYPYDGSQDSTKHPLLISPKDIVDSDNIVYTTYSTKKMRPGVDFLFNEMQKVGDKLLGIFDFWRLGNQKVVLWDGVDLKAIDVTNEKIDIITNAFKLPVDEAVSFVPFQGLLIIFFYGENTAPKIYNQTGGIADLSADAPNAAFGRVWLNRLVIPDPTVPGRLLLSSTGDPTDFTGGDSFTVDLDPNDGDPEGVTAIFPPFFGSLYVSKRLSLYKITPVIIDDTTVVYSQSKISDGTGCISHNGVVAVEGNIYFPSDRGWNYFKSTDKISGIDTDLLSKNIQPQYISDTNFNKAKYMQSVYDRDLNSILTIFPATNRSFPTDLWGYSLISDKWYRWRDYNHSAIARYINTGDKKLKTIVGSNNGNLGLITDDIKTDYGKKYIVRIQSGLISPVAQPDSEFAFEYLAPIFVPQSSGTFNILMKIDGFVINNVNFKMLVDDFGDTLGVDFITGESYLGGVPNMVLDKVRINGHGMIYELFIEFAPDDGDDENVDFEILGILLDVEENNRKTGRRVA